MLEKGNYFVSLFYAHKNDVKFLTELKCIRLYRKWTLSMDSGKIKNSVTYCQFLL